MSRASVAVPMEVLHATPCLPLTLSGPTTTATLRSWADAGGGWAFVSSDAVELLGLEVIGEIVGEGGIAHHRLGVGRSWVGDFEVDPSPVPWVLAPPGFFVRTGADVFLPAPVLAGYDVVFDYPGKSFEIGPHGSLDPQGLSVPAPISSTAAFPRIEVAIDGATYGMLLDTGASHTMVSAELFGSWRKRHPDWPVVPAALGTANMGHAGADRGCHMMRVPEVVIGGVTITNVSMVTRPPGTFEGYMSSMMSAPIVGALAGNVLQALRVGIHYRLQQVSFDPSEVKLPPTFVAPFNIGFRDGAYWVLDTLREVPASGDELVAVAGVPVAGQSFAEVVSALSGTEPGQVRVTVRSGDELRDVVHDSVEV